MLPIELCGRVKTSVRYSPANKLLHLFGNIHIRKIYLKSNWVIVIQFLLHSQSQHSMTHYCVKFD